MFFTINSSITPDIYSLSSIKSSTLNQFLNANKISSSSPKGSEMSIRDIGEKIEKATVYLDCWMTADKIQELKSKRVFFEE